jgi:uncharacterized protein YggE
MQTETQTSARNLDGITVTGEAVRATHPENAEFLIEISTAGATATQSLHDNHVKSSQVAQAVAGLGVQPADLQTISLNIYNLYSQATPALNPYTQGNGGVPQLGPVAFGLDVQMGSYQSRKTVRVNVRDAARMGEVVDAIGRAGATVLGAFTFRAADEAAARRAALEAAAKDARSKAEALATAAGKQLGDPMAVSEDIIASNGTYTALRAAIPFAFGAGAPLMTGDLEYYARVSARFKLA